MRLDKWLWVARFYKTRPLAVEAIERHRVRLNGEVAKPAHEVRPGDTVTLQQGPVIRTVRVQGLRLQRGPAPAAQLLYQETPESIAAAAAARAQRRLAPEPAHGIGQGRPTKRDRRHLDTARRGGWNERWSASLDEGTGTQD